MSATRVAVRFCLAVTVLLACEACGSQSRIQPSVTRPSPPTATADGSVASPSAAGTTRQAEGSCRSAELVLDLGARISEPTGQRSLSLTLTNKSTRSCSLFGYPTVRLLDAAGRELPFDYLQAGDQVVTAHPPTRVDLPPASTAFVTLNKYRCDLGSQSTAGIVELSPPGDTAALQVILPSTALPLAFCGPRDPGSTVAVSPVGATFGDTVAH